MQANRSKIVIQLVLRSLLIISRNMSLKLSSF